MHYGSTFENELFLDNFADSDVIKAMFRIISPQKLIDFIDTNTFSIVNWNKNISLLGHTGIEKKVNKILPVYYDKYSTISNEDEKKIVEKLFFANLFLSYVKAAKGDFALQLLTSELLEKVTVPQYIKEGLIWLQK